VGVTVDNSNVVAHLVKMKKGLGREGLRKVKPVAERAMREATAIAFRSGREPDGDPMFPRRQNPGWPLLRHTGGLRGSIEADAQVYSTSMYLRSMVKDNRSGNRSYHAVAGAIFYGRRDQRQRMIGRGSSRGRGGPMPGRQFTGVTASGQRRIAETIARNLKG
jgi:phage gpG-like protein